MVPEKERKPSCIGGGQVQKREGGRKLNYMSFAESTVRDLFRGGGGGGEELPAAVSRC